MESIDKNLGITLAIVSILSCVANYFNVFANPVLGINFVLGGFVMALAMMETYHYRKYDTHNPSWFWFIFSAVIGVILIATLCATSLKLIDNHLGLSIMGLSSGLLPCLGVFFGNIGRLIFKGESSVI